MASGTVKFFNEHKGYGFIRPDEGGNDAFIHISAIESSVLPTLGDNQRVSYDLQKDDRGRVSAVNLKTPHQSSNVAAAANDEPGQVQAE